MLKRECYITNRDAARCISTSYIFKMYLYFGGTNRYEINAIMIIMPSGTSRLNVVFIFKKAPSILFPIHLLNSIENHKQLLHRIGTEHGDACLFKIGDAFE